MKIEDTTIKSAEDLTTSNSYIILNTIEELDDTKKILKELLKANTIASKSDLITLENQNNKIVSALQSIVKRLQQLEEKIKEIENIKEKSPVESDKIIDDILKKLDENILEA